jgi:hypothetical protein
MGITKKKITEWIDNRGYYFDNETDNWWIKSFQIILITDPAGYWKKPQ